MSDRSEGYDQGRADANAHIIRLEVEIERLREGNEWQHKKYGAEIERLRITVATQEKFLRDADIEIERLKAEAKP
jgi:hypothetical protein